MAAFQPNPNRPPIVINIPDSRSSTRRRPPIRQVHSHAKLIGWLIALSTAAVLFCGLFPFDFVFHFASATDDIRQRFDLTVNQLYTAGDSLENVVFFLPTGFVLAALLWNRRLTDWIRLGIAAISAVALAAMLSTFVELSQVFLVSRDPSLADICSNTLGAAVGFAIFVGIGPAVIEAIARTLDKIDQRVTQTNLLIAAAIWLLLAVSLPLILPAPGSLANWSAAYPLMLGNETTGDRGWNGTVRDCWIIDRAFTDDEIDKLLSGTDPPAIETRGLLSEYHFRGAGPYPDSRGGGGVLHWMTGKERPALLNNSKFCTVGGTATTAPNKFAAIDLSSNNPAAVEPAPPGVLAGLAGASIVGAPMGDGWWLRSDDGTESAVEHRIAQANAFSVIADVQCSDVLQKDGPPRIISLSLGTSQCDLQLLQNSDALVIRLRTGATGDGGSDPEFVLPHVFNDNAPLRIAVTFANDRLTATSNRLADHDSFQFSPESSLIWRIYPRPGWAFRLDSSGQNTCAKIYRLLAIVPIGLLIGSATKLKSNQFKPKAPAKDRRRVRWGLAAVAAATTILEIVLFVESGHRPTVGTALTTIVFGLFACWLADRLISARGKGM